MGAQKEMVLKNVANVVNRRNQDNVVERATNYFKEAEIESRKEELNLIEDQKKVGPWVGMTDEGRKMLVTRETSIKKELRENQAPELESDTKDALWGRLNELETQIKDGMPPNEVMRRNPAGAVDWHTKWEKFNKPAVLERKNILRALNPGNTDKDLGNIELLRPSLGTSGDASVMVGAQIPGKFGYHRVNQESWDRTFGPQETKGALGEVERMEARIKELEGELSTQAELKEQKQQSAAKARIAKRDKATQGD